ncbi:class I SAM-dependent methyltransferase [Aestuariibacter sp. A3R04]|uniref:class I SAM-dependent methyltransferase n=1 Tax=Aestuariibacter sp. A3R04 TaxID=2841571 RepID=UPI001C09B539|nr:class I SAM-dependent methyltransferase [Aestuariibacter sp. A3R04]MBU3022191.1 class I SAM-dependent methyltransferase [Aestuariibacter sp. A3R04]
MEIDLLRNYPRTNRDTKARGETKTEEVRQIARQFGQAFFDGDRQYGYGGFYYNSRFWQPVIPDFKRHFSLTSDSCVLDVGCAKGFMLHDMREAIPGIDVRGVDISDYAVANAKEEVREWIQQACATHLPFNDNAFDVVISINTVHNLEQAECAIALQEIMRVSKGKAFITVDAYRNEDEKARMLEWNLTAKTIMHVDEWKAFFNDVGYTGDYYWFMP